MKILIRLVSLALLLSLGCSKTAEQRANKVIGVSLLARQHEFYRDLESTLQSEATKHGFELLIASADFDLGKQSAQVEDFIVRRVDAIILCPVDSRGIAPAIKKAQNAAIPVFTADIAAEEGEVVCHIASDNLAGGRMAAEYLAKLLNGKGEVALITHPNVMSALDRVQGFKEAIAAFPEVKIAAEVSGEGVRDKAMPAAVDILQAHPELDGIFGINDDSALGALDALQQLQRTEVVIVGYDGMPQALDAIRKGTALKADVVQYPKRIGETTIAKIADYFNGITVPKIVPVEVGVVDQASLQSAAPGQ